jgi:hypothetical protein
MSKTRVKALERRPDGRIVIESALSGLRCSYCDETITRGARITKSRDYSCWVHEPCVDAPPEWVLVAARERARAKARQKELDGMDLHEFVSRMEPDLDRRKSSE